MTKEEFIQKAKSVHGDKYDYSKVEYVSAHTKVCIICPKHGEFWQTPNSHLNGSGCPKCQGKKLTKDDFIQKAKAIHGDKYDYSKVEYINNNTPVCIICPEHGEFWQKPNLHLNGSGCPKCSKMDTKTFITKAHEVHGNKYDYSKTEYKGCYEKVCIICPEHGEFWQKPNSHLSGNGCPKCANVYIPTNEEFIQKARKIHGDKYDYSKVEYVNSYTDICIICPEHGEFWQKPSNHLTGYGCPQCSMPNKCNSTEEFITKAKTIHGDKYDYSKVEYINGKTKVCIICPEHGEFWQRPNVHLRGSGCPNCFEIRKEYKFNLLQEFKDEYAFRAFLENNDSFILYNILMNIEPKYEPIKKDIEKVLLNSSESDPIQALEDKYKSDEEDEVETEVKTESIFSDIDWDDDDAVNNAIKSVSKEEDKEISIEDVIRNTEQEIKVINRIEHMLTPEIREYIKEKFKNDMHRKRMAEKDK